MVYGTIAAMLVETVTRPRSAIPDVAALTLGNGWLADVQATSFRDRASTGDIYAGLWYPIIFASITAGRRLLIPAGDQGRHIKPKRRICRR